MEDLDMKICRLCLQKGSDNNDLIFVVKMTEFVEKIKECVSLEIKNSDEFPQTACSLCIQKVQDWYNFKQECLRSNEKLLEWKHNREKATNVVVPSEEEIKLEEPELVEIKNEKPDESLSETLATYVCEICAKNFSTVDDYLDHQVTHNGDPVFKCDKCAEVFTTREDLVVHDKKHKRRSPCPKCGKLIVSLFLANHLVKHTDRFKCSICNERFVGKYFLNQHIAVRHSDEKKHTCEVCKKKFSVEAYLKRHFFVKHLAQRTHKCNFCDYAAKQACDLKTHMAIHLNEKYLCHICSKVFKSGKSLQKHLNRVHLKEKKHECPYCYKTFVENNMLQVHIRRHKGQRPYVCKLCKKSFICRSNLSEHVKTHGERKFYSCDRCKKKYRTKQGITRHPCKP